MPAATIRFWEQEGLLSPRKEANRYRAYGPRELAEITGTAYSRIKISFDVICLLTTAVLTFFGLGRIMGLGVGTVLAAFTMGKCIGLIGGWMDRRVSFVSILSRRQAAAAEEG